MEEQVDVRVVVKDEETPMGIELEHSAKHALNVRWIRPTLHQ